MQLRLPVRPHPAGLGDALAAELLDRTGARDTGLRDHGHAVPREARSDAEVEGGVDVGQRRVEATEVAPDRATHEHAGRGDAEHVGVPVVLPLVEFVLHERERATGARRALAERADQRRVVDRDELGAGDDDGRCDLDGGQHLREGGRRRRVVVPQDPEPLLGGLVVGRDRRLAFAACDRLPKGRPAGSRTSSADPPRAMSAVEPSVDPRSTTTRFSGCRVCPTRPSMVRSRCSPPFAVTSTAVTRGRPVRAWSGRDSSTRGRPSSDRDRSDSGRGRDCAGLVCMTRVTLRSGGAVPVRRDGVP